MKNALNGFPWLPLIVVVGIGLPNVSAWGQVPDASIDRPNILLIIADDMGIETLASYGVGQSPASTPTLDRLADGGLRFDNFWSQPICSPTRATMLTGRYGFRTGVTRPTGDDEYMGFMPEPPPKPEGTPAECCGRGQDSPAGPPFRLGVGGPGLGHQEITLPRLLTEAGSGAYATAAIGKWHLADTNNGWEQHPNHVGFDHFAGLMRGFPEGYYAWTKVVNGEFSEQSGYGPSAKVDDALQWIEARQERPWFVWLAFNTPHTPLHRPPLDLISDSHTDLDPNINPMEDPLPYFHAMIEAMDSEIGRLLAGIDAATLANTYVIFMGDNGTTRQASTPPFQRGRVKGSIYEGGIRVPLIVAGPGVSDGAVTAALVNSTDMFASILELGGVNLAEALPADLVHDSVSFVPYLSAPGRPSLREWIYADEMTPAEGMQGGDFAIRDERFKLVRRSGDDELYNLAADPYERNDLLAGTPTEDTQARYMSLASRLEALHASGN